MTYDGISIRGKDTNISPTKLRELCPDGMDMYEANIGMARKPETKELAR